MGIARSTFYDQPIRAADDTAIVAAMAGICDEFEHYGWRRVQAALRQQGVVVNHKKVRRLMREHDLQPRMRRRFTTTTNSDHDQPIFPNLAKNIVLDGPDQIWVADITYVPVDGGFVYIAVILDAWSRRVVGYAINRSIDARLTLAALSVAIEGRKPPPGCVHHSDRGSQYAAKAYRDYLADHGIERVHGSARKSVRQRQGRKLHEDAEGRGRLSNGVRDTCRRRRKYHPNSSTACTMPEGYTQLSAISVLSNLRSNTPGRWSIQ